MDKKLLHGNELYTKFVKFYPITVCPKINYLYVSRHVSVFHNTEYKGV